MRSLTSPSLDLAPQPWAQSQASWVHGAPDEGDNDKRELLRSSNHPDEINGRERNLRFLKDADLHSKLLFGFIALCSQRFQNVQFPSVCPDKGQREVCRLPNGAKLRTVSTWLWKVFGSMNLHDIQSARSSQVITDPNEEAGMLAASFPCPPAQLLCTACWGQASFLRLMQSACLGLATFLAMWPSAQDIPSLLWNRIRVLQY